MEEAEAEEAEEPEEPAIKVAKKARIAPYTDNYRVENYKKQSLMGIRQKFAPKKQLFTFGGKHCGKSEDELFRIVREAMKKLETGDDVDGVKAWARAQ